METNEFKKRFDEIMQKDMYVQVHFAQGCFIVAQGYHMSNYKGKVSVDFYRSNSRDDEKIWTGTCYLKDIKMLA